MDQCDIVTAMVFDRIGWYNFLEYLTKMKTDTLPSFFVSNVLGKMCVSTHMPCTGIFWCTYMWWDNCVYAHLMAHFASILFVVHLWRLCDVNVVPCTFAHLVCVEKESQLVHRQSQDRIKQQTYQPPMLQGCPLHYVFMDPTSLIIFNLEW